MSVVRALLWSIAPSSPASELIGFAHAALAELVAINETNSPAGRWLGWLVVGVAPCASLVAIYGLLLRRSRKGGSAGRNVLGTSDTLGAVRGHDA